MKNIELTQGKRAIVDDDDYEYLSQWKWCATLNGKKWYAVRGGTTRGGKKQKKVYMHREIIEAGAEVLIDHKNDNSLDNRKINLRVSTQSQNLRNRTKGQNNTSGYKGVSFKKQCNKYEAHIRVNYKKMYLGLFVNPKDAAKAYNKAAIEYHGEFARLNEV